MTFSQSPQCNRGSLSLRNYGLDIQKSSKGDGGVEGHFTPKKVYEIFKILRFFARFSRFLKDFQDFSGFSRF